MSNRLLCPSPPVGELEDELMQMFGFAPTVSKLARSRCIECGTNAIGVHQVV